MEGDRRHFTHTTDRNNNNNEWQSSSQATSSGSSSSGAYSYYTVLEEQINLQAQKLTLDYLKKNKGTNNQPNDNEKVFIVYKFIQTPIEALIAGM